MRIVAKTAIVMLAVVASAVPAAAAAAAGETVGVSGGASATAGAAPAKPLVRDSAIATWFGPGFYGKKTACGQTLTPGVLGVANRTLPCGTLVRVTYSGHTLVVPVLDRGPYSHIGANWDLTSGAAEALGITETVRIRTRIVGSAPNGPTLGLPPASLSAAVSGGALAG